MGCVYLLGNPVNSLLLLASGLIQRPSENWGIPHDSRPFAVIVVLRLCWKSKHLCRNLEIEYRALKVDAGSSSVCSINTSGVVSFLTSGTCTLDATQAGDLNYLAATPVQQSITVSAAPGGPPGLLAQAPLTLTSTRGVVGTPLTLTSSGGSGTGVVSFALSSPGSATCALHGDTLLATRAGTCTLVVTKAGDVTYAARSSVATVTFEAGLSATRVTGDV